mmetsp:Transcript_44980/g.144125  ORF Transcript_44980/g.144125 Transcript_44980/m.144125 type:complete len:367 (-) Transcript_44980:25-1125(-)
MAPLGTRSPRSEDSIARPMFLSQSGGVMERVVRRTSGSRACGRLRRPLRLQRHGVVPGRQRRECPRPLQDAYARATVGAGLSAERMQRLPPWRGAARRVAPSAPQPPPQRLRPRLRCWRQRRRCGAPRRRRRLRRRGRNEQPKLEQRVGIAIPRGIGTALRRSHTQRRRRCHVNWQSCNALRGMEAAVIANAAAAAEACGSASCDSEQLKPPARPRSECSSTLPSLPREGRSASPRPAGRATPQTRSEHGRAASIIGSGRPPPERCGDMPFGRKHFPSMENFNSVGYTLHPNDATCKRKVTPEHQRASGVIMSVGTEVGGYAQGVSGSIKASHNVPAAIPLRTTRKVRSGGGSQVLSLGVAAALGA